MAYQPRMTLPQVKMLDVLGVPKKAPKEHKQDKTLDWDEGGVSEPREGGRDVPFSL